MLTLFWKELKVTTRSLTYLVFVICLTGFLYSQVGVNFEPLIKPQPNQKSYGEVNTTDKALIQAKGYTSLFNEYLANHYTTYPFGFIKIVRLSPDEQQQIETIIEQASQQKLSQLEDALSSKVSQINEESDADFLIPLKSTLDYQQFVKDMTAAGRLIGKGSAYDLERLEKGTMSAMTYDQALADYQQTIEKEKVSGAYARLVCDYLGIALGLVPVFLGATVCLRDKRAGAQSVIYSRSVSSIALIATRFFSTVVAMVIPVLVLGLLPGIQTLYIAKQVGVHGSLLIFFGYLIIWLVPTIVAVTGLSFLLTELFGGIVAIVTQLVWWFGTIYLAPSNLVGYVGFSLLPRFNTVGSTAVFQSVADSFLINRLFYLFFGVFCLGLMLAIYHRKRGGWHYATV